jgi:hypothetical protein
MKRFILLSVLIIGCFLAWAQDSKFGAGIIYSDPSGITAKCWIDQRSALDISLAWTEENNKHNTTFTGDYLWHTNPIDQGSVGKLVAYLGLGVRADSYKDTSDNSDNASSVKLRTPIGFDLLFEGIPMDMFLEFVPMMQFQPVSKADFRMAIGIRVWPFK